MRRILSRLAALGLLVVILAAAVLGVAVPLVQGYADGEEELRTLQSQIAAFRARRGDAPMRQPVEVADQALIRADSEALAGVELQQMVERALSGTEAALESRGIEKSVPEEHWIRIPLRLDLTVPESRLQRLLFQLESAPTYLFVEELVLRRQPSSRQGDTEPALQVRLRISGLMATPAP